MPASFLLAAQPNSHLLPFASVTAQHTDHTLLLQLHLQQQLQQQWGQPQPRIIWGSPLLEALPGSTKPQEPQGQTWSPQLASKSGVKLSLPNRHFNAGLKATVLVKPWFNRLSICEPTSGNLLGHMHSPEEDKLPLACLLVEDGSWNTLLGQTGMSSNTKDRWQSLQATLHFAGLPQFKAGPRLNGRYSALLCCFGRKWCWKS